MSLDPNDVENSELYLSSGAISLELVRGSGRLGSFLEVRNVAAVTLQRFDLANGRLDPGDTLVVDELWVIGRMIADCRPGRCNF